MCTDHGEIRHQRYANDIRDLQEGLRFPNLMRIGSDNSVYHSRRPGALITLGFRTDQLSDRYLMALQGFRLAQFLELGWVCPTAIANSGMFCEPTTGLRPDDIHVVTLGTDGSILGSLSLTGPSDVTSVRVDDPARSRFPVESAYGIDLLGMAATWRPRTTDQVRELRRFVHRQSMTDRMQRFRVTLELLLAVLAIGLDDPAVSLIIGDVQESVALRHLKLAGFQIHLVDGARATVDAGHYLHPAYAKRHSAKPFIAEVDPVALQRRMGQFEQVLSSDDLGAGLRELITDSTGTVLRLSANGTNSSAAETRLTA